MVADRQAENLEFSDTPVGEVMSYSLYNENGNKRRIFQNFLDAKAGDMIIGAYSASQRQLVRS